MHELSQVAEKMKAVRVLLVDADGGLTDGVRLLGPTAQLPEYRAVAEVDAGAIRLARAVGLRVVVLAGGDLEQLAAWCAEAGVEALHTCCGDRRAVVQALLDAGTAAESLAYLGSDVADLPAMALCGLQVAPRDAGLWVRQQADLVLASAGGRGSLRELVERLLDVQGNAAVAVKGVLAELGADSAGEWLTTFEQKVSGEHSKIGFRR